MLVLLHIDPRNWSRLLGVWRAPSTPDEFPECFYPEPGEGSEVGRNRMTLKGYGVSWE
jgi:hypothetical protein